MKRLFITKRSLENLPYAERLEHEANLIRSGKRLRKCSRENIYEEIMSSVKAEADKADSYLTNQITHLLKWAYQPEKQRDSRSWDLTIKNSQKRLVKQLSIGKNVQKQVEESLQDSYEAGVELAVKETGLPVQTFPEECPWSLKELSSLTREELVNLLKERN